MCKLRGGKLGNVFPSYRNYQEGAGIFPRYIVSDPAASRIESVEPKSLTQILKKSIRKRVRKTRRKPPQKNLIQNGTGQKRRRRQKAKSKPKKKRSRKRAKQTGGVRSLQKKKKRRVRKRVYKKGSKAFLNNNSSNFNF